MITIFLLWTILNGQPIDVDGFLSREACDASRDHNLAKQALSEDPAIKALSLSECQPITVAREMT